ncbi:MAG: hypothetical protein MRERV_61c010 [Mycoplasmataceae bacterium RV_VA103A]|nr:MAG: hypothetical protein MRERV_61c010 [Mycoplasmataceae bacterium RV_VA103A]
MLSSWGFCNWLSSVWPLLSLVPHFLRNCLRLLRMTNNRSEGMTLAVSLFCLSVARHLSRL